jgi:hypothetical protein
MVRWVLPLVLLAVLALAACSPVEDWRTVRPPGSDLQLLFPCKPVSQTRRVVLAGAPVELTLLACAAGGNAYALKHGDVVDPGKVSPALRVLAAASALNIGAEAVAGEPHTVAGMTPNPDARRRQLQGRLPDGRPVHEEHLTFARGTRVYQLSVLGPAPAAAAVQAYFASATLQP